MESLESSPHFGSAKTPGVYSSISRMVVAPALSRKSLAGTMVTLPGLRRASSAACSSDGRVRLPAMGAAVTMVGGSVALGVAGVLVCACAVKALAAKAAAAAKSRA